MIRATHNRVAKLEARESASADDRPWVQVITRGNETSGEARARHLSEHPKDGGANFIVRRAEVVSTNGLALRSFV
jgi:hypothetical protein